VTQIAAHVGHCHKSLTLDTYAHVLIDDVTLLEQVISDPLYLDGLGDGIYAGRPTPRDQMANCVHVGQGGPNAAAHSSGELESWSGGGAGSMVMTPRIGEEFVIWTPPEGGDEALGLVEFSIFPHVENPDLPTNTMAAAERWAAGLSGPAYAIDDETAIKVVDGTVEVVSEGHWKLFTRSPVATESG
jgi:peptidase S51-like protein